MYEKDPKQKTDLDPGESTGAEEEAKVINPRWEFIKFLMVVVLLTSFAVGNLFFRQIPLMEMRKYDFNSPFVFRNVVHDGELAFKACFRQQLVGFYGYYVCHKFPPTKARSLADGEYSQEQFRGLFIDQAYLTKFIIKFQEKRLEIGKDFVGFRIEQKPEDLTITPLFAPMGSQRHYSMR